MGDFRSFAKPRSSKGLAKSALGPIRVTADFLDQRSAPRPRSSDTRASRAQDRTRSDQAATPLRPRLTGPG